MTLGLAFILILLVAAAIGGISYVRAARLREGGRLHSLPAYHAAHAVLWILAPALLVLAAWTPLQNRLVDEAVLATPEGQALPDFAMQRDTILANETDFTARFNTGSIGHAVVTGLEADTEYQKNYARTSPC